MFPTKIIGLDCPGKICSESFCDHNYLMFILYGLMTYHWKGLKENYNFVINSTSITICIKSYNHTKFLTHLFSRNLVAFYNKLSFCSLDTCCSQGQPCAWWNKGLNCFREQPCPLGRNGPKLPKGSPGNKCI